jgi:uncharacterized protein DUF1570
MRGLKVQLIALHFVAYIAFATFGTAIHAETSSRARDTAVEKNDAKKARADKKSAKKYAAERVEFVQNGQVHNVTGRVLIEASDGGVLMQTGDGTLWIVQGDELRSRTELEDPFEPLTHDKLAEKLLADLPPGFRVHTTPHYVVCYNTSRAYAEWTSSLLERLHKAFTNYWQRQGLELHEPEFPLPVLVFAERQVYDALSRDDLPGGTGNIVGFYSLRSNRVNMFDLTGAEAFRDNASRRGSKREINQMLSVPAAVPLVSTIVHEATHQIAFNCGLQNRFADIPLWLCEGMAVYFEAPDLASKSGWRGIGRVNYPRLDTFQQNLGNWNQDSLEQLITSDTRFRNPQTAIEAYADAWALNYYLIKYKPRAYSDYLNALSKKRPLIPDDSKTRLKDFEDHFGDIRKLERDFLRQMSRAR